MQKIDLLRGFFGIGIYQPKHQENIGTLWRHAYLYNASFIFSIGAKYRKQCSDTPKSQNHIPYYFYDTYEDFINNMPEGCEVVNIELDSKAVELSGFKHPQRAVYLLGSESHGIPPSIMQLADHVVKLYTPKPQSMNVATTGTIVMYDRTIKQMKD